MGTNASPKHESISRIPVAYLILGYENNRKAITDFIRNAETGINIVTDAVQPIAGSKIFWMDTEIQDARNRGVRVKQISDITHENLASCKKLMARIDELRHLAGVRVVFAVSDREFIAMVPTMAPREEMTTQFIQSDSESVLAYKQHIFETLWERATPSHIRFDELEGKTTKASGATKAAEVIDRVYQCTECNSSFIFQKEVEEHKEETGHKNYKEYPLV
jgi:hypothetical protein